MASQPSVGPLAATSLARPPSPTALPASRRISLRVSPEQASYKWWVAATATFSAFLFVMNNATTNVALPRIMTAFSLNLDEAQWVITAYMIAGAMLVPAVGWLGNRVGNRPLFLTSLTLFILSSALCGCAWSGPSLIFFRVIQGLSGGPITPMAMVFLTSAFPIHQRGLAMGLYGMGMSFGPAIGPVIGGYITEYFHWRMVFFINIVPGLLCLALVWLVIPNTRETFKRSLDAMGLLTLMTFLVSALVALTQGQRLGWSDPLIETLLLVAGGAFIAFLCLELLLKEPLVDLRLYKSFAFSAASVIVLINSMNFWSTGFLQTILLQRLLEYTPAQAGFTMLPGALGMAVSTLLAGRLADKFDRRSVVICGLAIFAVSTYAFSFLTLDRPMSWVVWMIIARYVSVGFIFTPMNAASLSLLPPEKVRMGSGLINLMQQGIGGTTGLAMITTFLQGRIAYHSAMFAEQQVASSLSWSEVMTPVNTWVAASGSAGLLGDTQALALVQRHLTQQATVTAYQDCFTLVALLCLLSIPLVLCLRRQEKSVS